MKDARAILSLVRRACPQGVFPGRNGDQVAEWEPDPFHVLVSTVLSQRTRDANTFAASTALFKEFHSPQELAAADLGVVMRLIRPAGFPEAKARAVVEIARIVHQDLGGKVPDHLEGLMALPMVGRKTANCVLSYAFHQDAICVDTHVHRISNRIGLVATEGPEGTEMALMEVVPRDLWRDVNSLLVRFGQTVCLPRAPRCGACPVSPHCDYYSEVFLEGGGKVRPGRGPRPKAK